MTIEDIDSLVTRYEDAAIRHGSLKTVPAVNKAADEIAAIYRELRSRGLDVQKKLLPLLKHPDPSVRGWVAAHALEFAQKLGVVVLKDLEANSPPGAIKATAFFTLQEWRAGRLEFP